MIKHVVMWKLKDQELGRTKRENALEIKNRLMALRAIIHEIVSMEIGINVNETDPLAYDAVLIMTFNSMEDLSIYKNHPEHLKVSAFVKQVRVSRTVVDYCF